MLFEPGYKLKPCSGAEWQICGSSSLTQWVDDYAGILGLEKAEGLSEPFCFFYDRRVKDSIPEDILQVARKYRWRKIEYDNSAYFLSSETDSILYEIIRETTDEDRIYNMWFSLHPFYHHLIPRQVCPIHAGLVEKNGRGILLAAPGGTGKSTCCERLPKDWRVHCDDEALIALNHENYPFAQPLPTWSNLIIGKDRREWSLIECIKVNAIFFIEQSDVDEIIPLNQATSAALINQAIVQIMRRAWDYWGDQVKRKMQREVFDMACEMAGIIKGFKLRVSLDGKFWEEIESLL